MRVVEGWRRIDNQRGHINATTGQNLVVIKKEFGEHYLVVVFPIVRNHNVQGRKKSPEYATESKAEAFAMDWMHKHPKGA